MRYQAALHSVRLQVGRYTERRTVATANCRRTLVVPMKKDGLVRLVGSPTRSGKRIRVSYRVPTANRRFLQIPAGAIMPEPQPED